MKRITSFAAVAALLLSGASCQKQVAEPSSGSGEVMKTISVNLGDPSSKASAALAGEGAVEDATLFVWQHNAETGETTLYQKAYAGSSSFEFSLLFSDQTEYTYTINAWANMGELDAEPADGEILFSNEAAAGLQMKGSKTGIDRSSASAVTVDMKRYVGKITVAEVALEWTNAQNALQEFTLKSIYVANAGDKAEGATAAYNNVDGAYASSAMDAMLYSPVSSVIADGAAYETAQMMYAYGSGSTAIVLECDLGGQAMYYHVDYEPEWNTHRVFRFTVRQAGSDTPLGDLPEEALEVSVTTLNVLDFEQSESEESFGEASGSVPAAGAYIYDVDGDFYTAAEWTASGKDNSLAVGVAVSDGTHAFVIHPTENADELTWSSNTSVLIDGVFTTDDDATAETDFAGAVNTAAILAAVTAGTIEDAPAATYCDGITFAHGKKGYLPAVGEINLCYTYIDTINECMTAIGGTTFDMANKFYWTSTQCSAVVAWRWDSLNKYTFTFNKSYAYSYARAFAPLGVSGSSSDDDVNDDSYNGIATYTYNITSSAEFDIFPESTAPATVKKMLIDGVEVPSTTMKWSFDTLGEHEIKFYFGTDGEYILFGQGGIFLNDCSVQPKSILIEEAELSAFGSSYFGSSSIESFECSGCSFSGFAYTDGFEGCLSLTSVRFSDCSFTGNTSFQNAFDYCAALETVDFSGSSFSTQAGEEILFGQAFRGCYKLSSADMGTWNIHGSNAILDFYCCFEDCQSLESVKFLGAIYSDQTTCSNMFTGVNTTGKFYYEEGRDYNKFLDYLPSTWTSETVTP